LDDGFMLELWHVSLALLAVSFGAWFEIHSKYSDKVAEMEKARRQKTFDKMKEITKITNKNWDVLKKLFDASNEPSESHELAYNTFSYTGVLYLISVLARLGADYLSIQELYIIEGFVFLLGTIFFIVAILNTRNLMTLLKSDVDPKIPVMNLIVVATSVAVNAFIIWDLFPSFLASTLNVFQTIFFFLLWLAFIGSGIVLLEGEEIDTALGYAGLGLMFAPWIWMFIIVMGSYFNLF
jgi:hypothetical protein